MTAERIENLMAMLRRRFPGVAVSCERFPSGTVSIYCDLDDGRCVELEFSAPHKAFGVSRICGPERIFTGHDEVFDTWAAAEARLVETLFEATRSNPPRKQTQ